MRFLGHLLDCIDYLTGVAKQLRGCTGWHQRRHCVKVLLYVLFVNTGTERGRPFFIELRSQDLDPRSLIDTMPSSLHYPTEPKVRG
jgi:hypothetical protein